MATEQFAVPIESASMNHANLVMLVAVRPGMKSVQCMTSAVELPVVEAEVAVGSTVIGSHAPRSRSVVELVDVEVEVLVLEEVDVELVEVEVEDDVEVDVELLVDEVEVEV